jgi:hypothetical protein
MYEIIFDFSSSPIRGAVRRIDAYMSYFLKENIKVLFLLHPLLEGKYNSFGFVEVIFVKKNIVQKLFCINTHLRMYENKSKWFFSYGIPISKKIANKHWMHISNVLPFRPRNLIYKLSPILRLKMDILLYLFLRYKDTNSVVSAESRFSLDCYYAYDKKRILVPLYNGIEHKYKNNQRDYHKEYGFFAMVSGTQPYKRVDKSYKLFLQIRNSLNLQSFVVVGDSSLLSSSIKSMPHIRIVESLSDDDYFEMLRAADIFIASTEIENSSCAVLEAIFHSKKSFVSDIPSTREMLNLENSSRYNCEGDEYFVVNKNALKENIHTEHEWNVIIDNMMHCMNTFSRKA